MTHNDINPSLVCGLFGHPDKLDATIKAIHGRGGMRIREFRFIDISMSLEDDKFEDDLNFLKSICNPILARIIKTDIPFKPMIFKKLKLTPVEYPEKMWLINPRTPHVYSGFTPLFVDDKYRKRYPKSERENLDKLIKLESNYKDHEEKLLDEIKESVK